MMQPKLGTLGTPQPKHSNTHVFQVDLVSDSEHLQTDTQFFFVSRNSIWIMEEVKGMIALDGCTSRPRPSNINTVLEWNGACRLLFLVDLATKSALEIVNHVHSRLFETNRYQI